MWKLDRLVFIPSNALHKTYYVVKVNLDKHEFALCELRKVRVVITVCRRKVYCRIYKIQRTNQANNWKRNYLPECKNENVWKDFNWVWFICPIQYICPTINYRKRITSKKCWRIFISRQINASSLILFDKKARVRIDIKPISRHLTCWKQNTH